MKYAIIIPDGCADHPDDFNDGKTAMMMATMPQMHMLARNGIVGQSFNVPTELSPGSDVATLSLFGYDPRIGYTGRAPLEAAAQEIVLSETDWVFRCNLVCIENQMMKSFTAGHISSPEAAELIEAVEKNISLLTQNKTRFYSGVSYRNLMVYSSTCAPFDVTTVTQPPHDFSDKDIEFALPQGAGNDFLRYLMDESHKILATHPVNRHRIKSGKLPATHCWLWGQGQRPDLEPFAQRFGGVRGAMISAVDLLIGIAKLIGWKQIPVPGITGYVDTNYSGKGEYAAASLDEVDLICVHIEAPDEASHEGNFEKKVATLEAIDAMVIPPIVEKLKSFDHWRILISPDHPTQVSTKTHSYGAVPWLVAGSDISAQNIGDYHEATAAASQYHFDNGADLMPFFIEGFR